MTLLSASPSNEPRRQVRYLEKANCSRGHTRADVPSPPQVVEVDSHLQLLLRAVDLQQLHRRVARECRRPHTTPIQASGTRCAFSPWPAAPARGTEQFFPLRQLDEFFLSQPSIHAKSRPQHLAPLVKLEAEEPWAGVLSKVLEAPTTTTELIIHARATTAEHGNRGMLATANRKLHSA